MPVHIEKVTSDVTAIEGDLPLSQKQSELLTRAVLERLERIQREAQHSREATTIRSEATPPS